MQLEDNKMTREHDGRPIAAFGLIALGVLVLVGQLSGFSLFSTLWPLFVAAPGLVFLYLAYTGGKKEAGFAVPGTVVTGTGLILFYQNITGHWVSWAYAWTLYPLFVGLALNFMRSRTGDEGQQKASQILMRIGSIGFILGAVFFEVLLFNNGGIFGGLALPVILIGLGDVMLLTNKNRSLTVSKRKVGDLYVNGKYKNSDRLQQQIDEALAEDEPTPVV